jgi:predicted ferric reductase
MEIVGENDFACGSARKKGATLSPARNRSRTGSGAFPVREARIQRKRTIDMLYTIAVVLIILWLLGLVTSYTMGGLIHVLLVIAIVVVLLRVISGRSPI